MVSEAKVLKEVKWLEKEVESMKYPTKTAFLRAIAEMKLRLESEPIEFDIPVFLRRD